MSESVPFAFEFDTPEHLGMDENKLKQARDYAVWGGGSGCVLHGDRRVLAWGDQRQRFDLYSTTKSFGATVLGLALMDGKVALEDGARAHLPTMEVPPESNARTGWLEEVTLLQLATHTAGFHKFRGWCEQLYKPGTRWMYSDGGTNWLADCLTAAYGRDLLEVMTERVFRPLGISVAGGQEGEGDLFWGLNDLRTATLDGVPRRPFGAGIRANVEAMARFGYLHLRRGRWQGQQILPEGFVDRVRTTVPEVVGLAVEEEGKEPWERDADIRSMRGASNHYGLLWWNNADGSIAGVPRDAYWASGLKDSFIVVIPSLDIVAARAGDYLVGRLHPLRSPTWYNILKPFLEPICQSVARGAPYEPSTYITSMALAPVSTVRSGADRTDVFASTWADDDHLYTVYCDGRGFQQSPGKSMGFARIEGGPDDFVGYDFESDGEYSGPKPSGGKKGKKGCSLLMVDGVLYVWVRNIEYGTGRQSQLMWSADHGKHFTWAPWKREEFGFPSFINFGKNYAGVPGHLAGYVYIYSPDTPSAYEATDHVSLMRVPQDRIAVREAYQFFRGCGPDGQPTWSDDAAVRKPAFTYPGGCSRMDVVYNAPLKRFMLCMRSGHSDHHNSGSVYHFGIYDAPQPWGPWSTVYHTNQWEGTSLAHIASLGYPAEAAGWGESGRIFSKWISRDGKTVYVVYSGDDRMTVRAAQLTAAPEVPHWHLGS